MSTQPHTRPRAQPTETEPPRTANASLLTRDAPMTFSPHNTDPCPAMFSEKWRTEQ